MRRLLALLLVLMLPVCALADSNRLTFEVQADANVFPAWAQTLLKRSGQINDVTADKYAKALGALLKDLRVRIITQDDAVAVEIDVAGGSLLDVTIGDVGESAYLSSSLIPGYAVAVKKQNTSLPSHAENDWSDLGEGIMSAMNHWFADIQPTKTYGVYYGDAYDGGTQCTTWIFDDQDVASLVSAVMNPQMRDAVSKMLVSCGVDAAKLLQQFDGLNDQVSKKNAHCYIVRLVQNDKAEIVGISLTITQNASQLATASLGFEGDNLHLVVGLGLNSENYWWEYSVQRKQKNHLTLLKGESREWTAPKEAAFSYVKETCVPAAAHVWNCNLTQSGSRFLWDGSVYSGESPTQEDKCCTFSGVLNPDASAFNAEVNLISSSRIPIRIRLSSEHGNAIVPLDASATICSLTADEDEQLINQLSAKFSIEATARLMKLLPLDVIMTLGEMLGQ